MLYKGHRFFTKDVKLIWPCFKDFCWTNFWALTASIAFVRIDGDIPVAGPIPKTIIGNHVISFLKSKDEMLKQVQHEREFHLLSSRTCFGIRAP